MSLDLLAWASLVSAAIPASLIAINLLLYRRPRPSEPQDGLSDSRVSVLIPARDEEASIGAAIDSVLSNQRVDFELLVLDDHSTDRTAEIVSARARRDPRVRLLAAESLPAGWCGKQFACHQLARHASADWLLFIDSDVRLSPDALSRVLGFATTRNLDLASGVPRQLTGTFLERLLIPLIHFVLLGFLPIRRMRRSPSESYAAGCGQLFLARRSAYHATGGHAAIRGSLHDGLQLPRAFRRSGFRTDLFDATGVAVCRMYHSSGETWRGLGKNAIEGLASPRLIVPATGLLLLGQVMPLVLVACSLLQGEAVSSVEFAALLCAMLSRAALALRFGQSWVGVALHPVSVLMLCAIQWQAFGRWLTGRPSEWKGRAYPAAGSVPAEARTVAVKA